MDAPTESEQARERAAWRLICELELLERAFHGGLSITEVLELEEATPCT